MEIPIGRLTLDPRLQPRVDGLDPSHIAALRESGEWPPLTVARQQEHWTLVDGWHRLAAAQDLGRMSVTATVIDVPDDEDLYAMGFALNAGHGKPLTLGDRRAFGEHLLRQHPDWADRAIGRQTGLSSNTVGRLRESLAATTQFEQPSTRVGAGGYTYRVGTNAKQRPSGELPDTGLGEVMGQLLTRGERRAQRQIADYVRRLAIALEDGGDVEAWENARRAAEACLAVLGRERCERLAGVLGRHGRHLLAVAKGLGWTPEAAS